MEETAADFDSASNPTNWGGVTWGGDTLGSGSYDSTLYYGPASGSSLRIDWWGVNSSGLWGGGGVAGMNVDVSTYNAVSFHMYSANPGCNVMVQLQDTSANIAKVRLTDYLTTGTSVWQSVIIPIDAFKRQNRLFDASHFKELNLISEFDSGNDSSGTIHIDDVKFSYGLHAPARSWIYSGGDNGVANTADVFGDTLMCYDQSAASMTTNAVTVFVSTTYAAAWVSEPQNIAATEAITYYVPFSLKNSGNSADSIVVSTDITSGSILATKLYWDKDKSGTYTIDDVLCSDTSGLLPESTFYFLAAVTLTSSIQGGTSTVIRLTAKDNNGSGANDSWPTAVDDDTITSDFVVSITSGYAIGLGSLPADKTIAPGTTAYYAYTIYNAGKAADSFTLSVSTISGIGWNSWIVSDANANGAHDSNENTAVSNSGTLNSGTSYYFFVAVGVPWGQEGTTGVTLTVKDQNGSGAEDHYPVDGNDIRTHSTVTTATMDKTPPVITVQVEPPAKIGMIGNRLLCEAKIEDAESSVLSVKFIYSKNSGAAQIIELPILSSAVYSYDLNAAAAENCAIEYSWLAENFYGYTTASSTKTIVVNRTTTSNNFASGTLFVDDGNPDDGQTSITVPAGALSKPVDLTVTQAVREDSEKGNYPATTLLPSTAYDFGPEGTVFNKPVTMTLLYTDLDRDGSEDSSGKEEKMMRAYWWDGFEWRLLGGKVDTDKKTVTVSVMHLSRYAVFPTKVLSPSDYRPKERIITPCGSIGKNDFVQFGTSEYPVNIFDITGAKVRTLTDSISIWKGEDENGNIVESGIYIYQIKTTGEVVSGTILVVK
ncbi:MAG: hypothetical protein A2204_08030 [Elusimicrobia bacterium RIFOXYA1_FULL_47_7]|nr:MAG: hypothetical protein A2278_00770 [Elusimicrobia bacterium RIFOXYA12_FULL_49_49]OGS06988.1 MAG: hypothetical protein A2204_08030 [Elusimicrobia bacterium RIFOXYA1_FULL_47_7]OGS10651.1 MAG: hypothetical protein A2386_00680 [Elusimicrobia bacterium RIFOXYB1_FULL_48_9]OGS15078.1 MAG: hypothetical protein A2251_00270 [Elusimicrobia bacterium RIFOXYA2_FULL_47_53]OGS29416.1 MAG: hypothetical protein A2323_00555 [Elusimicrobia bacterium RIFOXYB2_FULL_46_23]